MSEHRPWRLSVGAIVAVLAIGVTLSLTSAPAASANLVRTGSYATGIAASAPLAATGVFVRSDPKIGGELTVGSQLAAYAGAFSPAGATVRYQWYADGSPLAGATAKYLRLDSSLRGSRISVRVQLSQAGYQTSVRWGKRAGVVEWPAIQRVAPKIGGKLTAGTRLTAYVGAYAPAAATVRYQWYIDGAKVAGATAKYYTYTSSNVGKRVTVRVQLSLAGYATSVRWATRLPCSIDDPTSRCVVVNKKRPLDPLRYAPADLVHPAGVGGTATMRSEAAVAMSRMHTAAKAAGADFWISSGYRSYATQASLYSRYVNSVGQAKADTFSARPGYSEHQTGWTADITDGGSCTLKSCFGDRAAARWVAAHAADYGFIVRYPEGMQSVTGYIYEPWHLRYVGVDVAKDMRARGIDTLEQYYSLPAAPSY